MEAEEFRGLLKTADWSLTYLAERLGVRDRQARAWASGKSVVDERVGAWLRDHALYQQGHWLPEGWSEEKPENERGGVMARFRQDNTEGYSDADLAILNARFDEAVYLPPDALERMGDLERGSWEDHCAEQVMADFDAAAIR